MTADDQPQHTPAIDAAAYVLGAMEPEEALRYQRHLNECEMCRNEVAALERVIGALGVSAPQYAAPPSLRGRILDAVNAEAHTPDPTGRARPERRWPVSRRIVGGIAGVIAAVAAAVVIAVSALSGSSPSTRLLRASVTHSSGVAQLHLVDDRGTLIVRDFPLPAPGHIYEVWLRRANGTLTPTGTLFSVTAAGSAEVGVPESLRTVRAVLVTQEPSGGTSVPTSEPLIVAQLS